MTTTGTRIDLRTEIATEFLSLADLLETAPVSVWDAPSLCEGWRIREVVAHVTMPARYDAAAFMAEMATADGDFTVVHGLDVTEAAGLGRTVPATHMALVLGAADPGLFGTDLTGVELRADDLDWSYGSGELVTGPAQVLALVVCGRVVPTGRLGGNAAHRFAMG